MTQHTPGPWHINEWQSGPAFSQDRVYIESGFAQVAIAEHRPDSTEKWANARLIAAAPEMLEIIRSIASPGINHGAARALLARIEGKES